MAVDYEALKEEALSCGFSHVGDLNADTIVLRPEVRAACAENKCHSYGKNWVCPPGCGTLEECGEQIHSYKRGLILQTTGEMEDSFDVEAMMELAERQGKNMSEFASRIRKRYPGALVLGDGQCRNCKTCTYPDAPCRFPEKRSSAMEAYGMVVSEVCAKNDIPYYYGPGTLTYVGCILIE
jgi:predicted metal-binding protein